MTVEPAGAPTMRPIWSPTSIGVRHQPSAQARIPRSAHMRAKSASRSAAFLGIGPRVWLARYVVCSRIGNSERYARRSRMSRSLPEMGTWDSVFDETYLQTYLHHA